MAEDVLSTDCSSADASRSSTVECTSCLLATHVHKVRDKLRRHPSFMDYSEEELTERAAALSDESKLLDTFFSHILKPSKDSIHKAVKEAERISTRRSYFTERESRQASKRAEERFATVCSFPMKLVLTRIGEGGSSKGIPATFANSKTGATFASYLKFPFGAFHAALMIGDVLLEWDGSSLVIPERKEVTPTFQAGLERFSFWNRFTSSYKSHMRETLGEEPNYNNQVEVMLIINNEKESIMSGLVQEIVRYNTQCSYSLNHCNCQHFVLHAMRVLRIFKPPNFAGRLKGYFDTLCRGQEVDVQRDFRTHLELDEYVRTRKGALDQDEVDYLCCVYTDFHRQAGMGDFTEQRYPKHECQMARLEELVAKRRLLQHKLT